MARKKKKDSEPKQRNYLAVHAHNRSGAGNHGDARKEKSRRACRGKAEE